jgi:hypothetical protein
MRFEDGEKRHPFQGEVAEWSNAAVSKTVVRRKSDPGFKSQPLRHLDIYE